MFLNNFEFQSVKARPKTKLDPPYLASSPSMLEIKVPLLIELQTFYFSVILIKKM